MHFNRDIVRNILKITSSFFFFFSFSFSFFVFFFGSLDYHHLQKVFYNNINVFKRAKERTSHVTSVHVAWTCSSEFDADQRQSISFVRDDSFVMLAKPVVQTGER